jgi:hypothetical protein
MYEREALISSLKRKSFNHIPHKPKRLQEAEKATKQKLERQQKPKRQPKLLTS